MFIIELENGGNLSSGVWIAPWEGDPGRTLKQHNAKQFKDQKNAEKALGQARKYRPFKNAKILRQT